MDGKGTKKSWIEYALDLFAVIMVSLIVGELIRFLQSSIAYLLNPCINQTDPTILFPYLLAIGFITYGIDLIINNKNKQK